MASKRKNFVAPRSQVVSTAALAGAETGAHVHVGESVIYSGDEVDGALGVFLTSFFCT